MPVVRRMSARGRRRTAVVSTSRADYGLLHWILRGLARSPRASLQLILMGSHFSPQHGATHRAVRADGFRPAAEIRVVPQGDSDRAIARSIGRATVAVADAFARLRPDLVVVLGDRYELLAVGAAATVFRLPIAHLHGGEVYEGADHEGVRPAPTKHKPPPLLATKAPPGQGPTPGEEGWRLPRLR